MRVPERAAIKATLMAIKEINDNGTLKPHQLLPVLYDGCSDPTVFAKGASSLLEHSRVEVIFGCWTSAARIAVREKVHAHESLLVYPIQSEGLERSARTLYVGSVPNQQIFPAIDWCLEHECAKSSTPKFFLLGSDYIFPRAAHMLVDNYLQSKGLSLDGHAFVPFDGLDHGTRLSRERMDTAIDHIRTLTPHFVLNFINGEQNALFFRALRGDGGAPTTMTMSFSFTETELLNIKADFSHGLDYLAWNYFHESAKGDDSFAAKYKTFSADAQFGGPCITDASMWSAYAGVHLWAKAVLFARDVMERSEQEQKYWDPALVHKALQQMPPDQTVISDGVEQISIAPGTAHCVNTPSIGRIQVTENGVPHVVVIRRGEPTPPMPFPNDGTEPEEWQSTIDGLYVATEVIPRSEISRAREYSETILKSIRPPRPTAGQPWIDLARRKPYVDSAVSYRATLTGWNHDLPTFCESLPIHQDAEKVERAAQAKEFLKCIQCSDPDIREVVRGVNDPLLVIAKAKAVAYRTRPGNVGKAFLFDILHYAGATLGHSVTINGSSVASLADLACLISEDLMIVPPTNWSWEFFAGLHFPDRTKAENGASVIHEIENSATRVVYYSIALGVPKKDSMVWSLLFDRSKPQSLAGLTRSFRMLFTDSPDGDLTCAEYAFQKNKWVQSKDMGLRIHSWKRSDEWHDVALAGRRVFVKSADCAKEHV